MWEEEQKTLKKEPKITISALVNKRLWDLRKQYGLSWTEALELGLKIMLADLDELEYPSCKLKDQRDRARRELAILLTKKHEQEENGEKTEDEKEHKPD